MFNVSISRGWQQQFTGSHIGMLLIDNIDNSKRATPLDEIKKDIELKVRKKFAGYSRNDLIKLDTLRAYKKYYGKFDKTYHVLLQLESVAFKNKTLPSVNPLVDACFAAEMDTHILTAGHDADLLEGGISIEATIGTECFSQLNGKSRTLKANDMMMRDEKGIVCTILYGQDQRTPISPNTKRALYVAYVPAGITRDAVNAHLNVIKSNVLAFSPEAEVRYLEIHNA